MNKFMKKSTISVSLETLRELGSLKKKSVEKAWKYLRLDEKSAKELEKIIKERRETW
jgi:hypothetical protein